MSDLVVETNSSSSPGQVGRPSESSSPPDPFHDHSESFSADSVLDIVESHEPFFMGGDRRAVLDEAVHLCQFSNNLVAVLGEAGVGKTALIRQLLRELHNTAQCCLVRSSIMTTALDVFRDIAKQVGAFLPETSSVEQIIDVLAQYQPADSQQRIIVLVDDAHHLNDEVLGAFVALLQGQSIFHIHILLVGDSSLLQRLDYVDKGDVLVYDIPLCPFNTLELEEYLSFRLESVGYEGIEVFDVETVQRIWDETRGIPATVNRYASNLLSTQNEHGGSRTGLPLHYMALLVIVLAALIMSLFYFGDDIDNKELDKQSVQEDPTIVEAPQQAPVIEVKPREESAPVDLNDSQPEPAEKGQVEQLTIDSPSVHVDITQKQLGEEKSVEKAPETDNKSAIKDDAPVNLARKAEFPQPPPVTAAPVTTTPPSRQRPAATRDEEVVMFWPDDKYTLQVIAAGQLKSIEKFVASQPNRELLRIVRFERKSKPWYVVLVGVYSTVAEARKAIASLPAEQVKSKPWPRRIDDVKSKIEDFKNN